MNERFHADIIVPTKIFFIHTDIGVRRMTTLSEGRMKAKKRLVLCAGRVIFQSTESSSPTQN
jgi:hypothetical protein